MWRKIEAARDKGKVVLWKGWRKVRTPLQLLAAVFQSYPRGYGYIWKCTQGLNGKREGFLNQWGISLKEETLCGKKTRLQRSERPGFKSQLSQFLIGWLWTDYVTYLGFNCVIYKTKMTVMLIKYNSECFKALRYARIIIYYTAWCIEVTCIDHTMWVWVLLQPLMKQSWKN